LEEEGSEVSGEEEGNLGAEDYGGGDEEVDEKLRAGLSGVAVAWAGKGEGGAECVGC